MEIEHETLTEDLRSLVAREGMIDPDSLKLDTDLADLGIASADFVMILMAIEEEYDVYISVDTDITEAKTVGDFLTLLKAKIIEDQPE